MTNPPGGISIRGRGGGAADAQRATMPQRRCAAPGRGARGTPGDPWGLRKGLGGRSKTGENSGIFLLKNILPTKMGYDLNRAKGCKRVILLANAGIYSI